MNVRAPGSVVLIGYRGSGKSSVGRALAARLGVPHLDTDELVASAAGTTIAEIFKAEGEPGFRRRESQAVQQAVRAGAAAISAGGGVVESEANMRRLKRFGYVVWLTAPPETLQERIQSDQRSNRSRPDLTPHGGLAEIEQVLARREPLYQRWADLQISTDSRSVNQVADEILSQSGFSRA
jgi:shikimate kinase